MSTKSRFWVSFKKEDSKTAQTLMKSEGQYLYHIYWSMQWAIESQKVSVSDIHNLKTVC